MATAAGAIREPRAKPLAPDIFERALAVGAAILLGFVAVALFRGRSQWAIVPAEIWAHIATITVALALTPVMLLRRRGDALHRRLGWIWVVAMFLTALLTFAIRHINGGSFSFIHILSAWTLIQVPVIAWAARTHDVKRHRRGVRAMVLGALLIAGFFTFPFNRLLGHWLFATTSWG
jgi:uncharacterized membrane protein